MFEGSPLTSRTLLLSWEPPPEDQQNGIIQEYRISITATENGDHLLLTSKNTTVLATDLHPYYTYNCIIAAVTVGLGPYSEILTVHMPEDGNFILILLYILLLPGCILALCFLDAAPSSPPQILLGESLSPTVIYITWEPPPSGEWNGIIRSYTLIILEVVSNTTATYQQQAQQTQLLIEFLHPYYNYTCTLAAETIELGPFTSPLTITTDEDGKCVYTV